MDVSEKTAIKIISKLIELGTGEGGYRSEAALARCIGVEPRKLNRWKLGKNKPPASAVSLALILLSCDSASSMKDLLDKRAAQLAEIE